MITCCPVKKVGPPRGTCSLVPHENMPLFPCPPEIKLFLPQNHFVLFPCPPKSKTVFPCSPQIYFTSQVCFLYTSLVKLWNIHMFIRNHTVYAARTYFRDAPF